MFFLPKQTFNLVNYISRSFVSGTGSLSFLKNYSGRSICSESIIRTEILAINSLKSIGLEKLSPINLECSALDDLRRDQFNRIVGKIGIKKKDAGMYWKQYKTKRIKIKKRKRVI